MRASSRARGGGFILVVVLWLLVAMAIACGLLLAWSRERVVEATAARAELEERRDAIGTRDSLLFLLATIPTTRAGLPVEPLTPAELAARRLDEFGGMDKTPRGGELRLDGHVYAGLGAIRVQLQDEAGLVPVALPAGPGVHTLLAAAGRPRAERNRLAAALEDYVDPDDFRRFGGAESAEYERAGLPAPPGRPLLALREIWHVLGWNALPPSARRDVEDWSTVAYSGAMNLNTAPLPLLEALLGDCRRVCRARLEARAESPFETAGQFDAEAGVRLPGDRDIDFRTAPSDTLRLTLSGRSGRAWRMHVRLTPLAHRAAPWHVDAAYRLAHSRPDDAPRPIPSPLFAPPPMD